jgi:hypothetical protein
VIVGEQGPEIVRLPFGSTVRTNSDSRRLASQAGQSQGPLHVTLMIGEKKLGDLLIDPMKNAVRTRGGLTAVFGSR